MAELVFKHSEEWMEKLTVPPQELSPSERDAIAQHLASCPDCARTRTEYDRLERLIAALPAPDLSPGLSPKLLEIWREEDKNAIAQRPTLHLQGFPHKAPDHHTETPVREERYQ